MSLVVKMGTAMMMTMTTTSKSLRAARSVNVDAVTMEAPKVTMVMNLTLFGCETMKCSKFITMVKL